MHPSATVGLTDKATVGAYALIGEKGVPYLHIILLGVVGSHYQFCLEGLAVSDPAHRKLLGNFRLLYGRILAPDMAAHSYSAGITRIAGHGEKCLVNTRHTLVIKSYVALIGQDKFLCPVNRRIKSVTLGHSLYQLYRPVKRTGGAYTELHGSTLVFLDCGGIGEEVFRTLILLGIQGKIQRQSLAAEGKSSISCTLEVVGFVVPGIRAFHLGVGHKLVSYGSVILLYSIVGLVKLTLEATPDIHTREALGAFGDLGCIGVDGQNVAVYTAVALLLLINGSLLKLLLSKYAVRAKLGIFLGYGG